MSASSPAASCAACSPASTSRARPPTRSIPPSRWFPPTAAIRSSPAAKKPAAASRATFSTFACRAKTRRFSSNPSARCRSGVDCRRPRSVSLVDAPPQRLVRHRDQVGGDDRAQHAPQAARLDQDHGDRHHAQDDEVPDADFGEVLADEEEHDGADDRSLEAADAADHHDEDDVDRPVGDAEGRRRSHARYGSAFNGQMLVRVAGHVTKRMRAAATAIALSAKPAELVIDAAGYSLVSNYCPRSSDWLTTRKLDGRRQK